MEPQIEVAKISPKLGRSVPADLRGGGKHLRVLSWGKRWNIDVLFMRATDEECGVTAGAATPHSCGLG
ncbi:hypothetical protein HMPREF2835_05825 [Actinomyces sp. HMSC072A03]|nr:hypothetical protein HMPREF2835_05825 [Actinomyces sp. HMSC072A03]